LIHSKINTEPKNKIFKGYKTGHSEKAGLMNNHTKSISTAIKSRLSKILLICMLSSTLLGGCGVVKFAVVATVAVVGFAGYAVYKTGEAVVTGVGKAGSAVGTGVGAAVSVVFINGDFKTQYHGDVETVWRASRTAFGKACFSKIEGSFDALSGKLTAVTREGTEITLKLKTIDPQSTAASIRVGITGDMELSETIHNLILQELSASSLPPALPGSVQETK
jgi:hypothetical protein